MAKADKDYQKAAKVMADKVSVTVIKTMNGHPIQVYKEWLVRMLVIKKEGTRLILWTTLG